MTKNVIIIHSSTALDVIMCYVCVSVCFCVRLQCVCVLVSCVCLCARVPVSYRLFLSVLNASQPTVLPLAHHPGLFGQPRRKVVNACHVFVCMTAITKMVCVGKIYYTDMYFFFRAVFFFGSPWFAGDRYGAAGLPPDTIHVKFDGHAGQSFGFTLAKGVFLEVIIIIMKILMK